MGCVDIADAVAIKGDRILAVGTVDQVRDLIGQETTVLQLKGRTVVPGFIDSHCHVSGAGTTMVFEVDVGDAQCIDDVVGMLRDKGLELPEGRWLLGRNYDDRRLREKEASNPLGFGQSLLQAFHIPAASR